MKSFGEFLTEIQDQTFDTTSAGAVTFKRRINDGIRYIARRAKGVFLNKTSTLTTSANTQFKDMPFDVGKVRSVYVTVSTTRYPVTIIEDRAEWDRLNQTSYTSDIPEYAFIENSSTGPQLGLFPIPATSNNVITVNHQLRVRNLVASDYTTGTVTAVSNGGTTITGSGTIWTSKMIGRWIRIDLSDTAGSGDGDGEWYQISGRSSNTSITIARAYNGTTISAGSATYTIGEMSVIPEGHEDAVTDYVLWKHYARIGDMIQAAGYKNSLDQHIRDLMIDSSGQSESMVLDPGITQPLPNPNLFLKSPIS